MPVIPMKAPVRVDCGRRMWLDFFVGPLVLLVALVLSLGIPVRGYAQTNMTLGQLIPDLIRNTSQTVTATSAGLQVAEAGSVGIRSGSALIGTVLINELRSIPLSALAGRVVTSSAPVVLAMLAVDLIKYGITQCASSPNGWCQPGPTNPSQGDTGFNGYQWCYGGGIGNNVCGSSPSSACAAVAATQSVYTYVGLGAAASPTYYYCVFKGPDGTVYSNNSSVSTNPNASPCVSGYVNNGGGCVPDPNANVKPVPITYPALSPKLADALSGNPQRAKDYWGFMPWTDQLAALGDPSTQALPAQVVSPADGKVTGPSTTTQGPNGTTTQQRSCTVSPNSDSSTLANKPVSVVCTVTTTNPDGTTSTTTTTTNPTTGDGANPQPAPVPASSPIPCGLGTNGSPKCLIDETGTPTKADGATAMTQPATDLQTAGQAAEAQLQTVNNNRSWTLSMPHILPGGTCQPIEWFSWGNWRGSWDVCTQLQYVRDLLAWLWPVLSAVYVWNKAAGANAGVV